MKPTGAFLIRNAPTQITTRYTIPNTLNVLSTVSALTMLFMMSGRITEPKPYVAVVRPPTRPALSGKNLIELPIVQP